ncbi:transposase [Streptomyces inhibens]|uniref:transposase n=1 Tax=Streptomyces inhibens TaxID=2293571 RepID=UPI0036844D96
MGGNPERLSSEASFVALCGVSPIERSSGRHHYRRLNRGGDRQANAALHRIVQTSLPYDPRTGTTMRAASRRARPGARSSDASNATLPVGLPAGVPAFGDRPGGPSFPHTGRPHSDPGARQDSRHLCRAFQTDGPDVASEAPAGAVGRRTGRLCRSTTTVVSSRTWGEGAVSVRPRMVRAETYDSVRD